MVNETVNSFDGTQVAIFVCNESLFCIKKNIHSPRSESLYSRAWTLVYQIILNYTISRIDEKKYF